MFNYLVRRILLMVPTLFGITLVVFAVMATAPGGLTAQGLVDGQNLEPEAKQALLSYYNRIYGLDQPAYIQYLRWLNNVSPVGFILDDEANVAGFDWAKGSDLGTSFRYGRPVLDLVAERVPITLALNLLSLPLIYAVAIVVGVYAAERRGSRFDTGSSLVALALWSVPTMLAGIVMIGFFGSEQYWRWFPIAGLSFREALDMPFLPHFGSTSDVVRAFVGGMVGAGIATVLALMRTASLRQGLSAVAGLMLGITAYETLPSEGLSLPGLVVVFAVVGAAWLMACIDSIIGRAVAFATIGTCVGLGIGFNSLEEPFTRGFLLDRLWHLVLPVLCLSYSGIAFVTKLVRSSVLENRFANFARTARAKGVDEGAILWRHVFRASLLPLITIAAGILPAMLGGSVIVESIFSIDGMGKLAVEAVKGRDRELVLSLTLVSGCLTLIGYLIADVCYAIADPRVSFD